MKQAKDSELTFRKIGEIIVGYADAGWAGCIDDRYYYTEYAFVYGNVINAINSESRRPCTIARSSTEAEYMTFSHLSKDSVYSKNFVPEITWIQGATAIYNSNKSAYKLCGNLMVHKYTKHVDIMHHFSGEPLESGDVCVECMPTEEMPADVVTKRLCSKRNNCTSKLG